jgi:peptidyl-tRNA hydrolase
LGIGREGRGETAVVRYVLSDFTLREQQWLEQVFLRAEKQVQAWSEVGVEKAMSWFNGQVPEQGDK